MPPSPAVEASGDRSIAAGGGIDIAVTGGGRHRPSVSVLRGRAYGAPDGRVQPGCTSDLNEDWADTVPRPGYPLPQLRLLLHAGFSEYNGSHISSPSFVQILRAHSRTTALNDAYAGDAVGVVALVTDEAYNAEIYGRRCGRGQHWISFSQEMAGGEPPAHSVPWCAGHRIPGARLRPCAAVPGLRPPRCRHRFENGQGCCGGRLGPVRPIFAGPRRLARHLAALSESPEYVQYTGDPPPCDAPRSLNGTGGDPLHQTPRSDPRRPTGQDLAPGVLWVAAVASALSCVGLALLLRLKRSQHDGHRGKPGCGHRHARHDGLGLRGLLQAGQQATHGITASGAGAVAADGNIGRAVTGNSNRLSGPSAPAPVPGAAPAAPVEASGPNSVSAGDSIGEAVTGDGNST